MTTLLRVLIVEDSEDDAQLILHQLRSGAYDPRWERVDTPEAMTDSLNREQWDVILCDYKMPRFSAPAALKLVQEREIDIPFIVVSGNIGEDTAVAMMKAGAHDFLMKDKLARLIVAIEREMREVRIRREKKRAEEVLKIKNWAIESALVAIAISDLAGNLNYVNPAFLKLWGYSSPAEVLGKSAVGFWPLGEKAAEVMETLHTCGGWSGELVALRKDGALFNVSLAASMVLDASSSPICMMASFIDITERKRAAVAMRESEARYRTLFEHSADGILIADLETKAFKYANKAMCRMLGYTEDELRILGVSNIHPKEALPRVAAEFEAQTRGEKTLAVDLPCLRKDGTIFCADVNATTVAIDGRPCLVGFFRDTTERKRTEEARRQAEENFRRSMDESPLGIRVVSAQGETLYANQAILDIWGYEDIEELRSTPLKNLYTPESYAEYQSRKKKRMNGEVSSSEYEINILRKTGEIRCLRVIRKNISWNGQKNFQTIYQDITEQKKSEEKLRETLSGLRDALGGIIQVLSSTTEKRDPYTAGHQRRVADLARAIGQEMGLDTERVEGLRLTGTIHDIGKIAIPAEILSKPGSLTETEFKLIQTHPEVGHDILGDINFSWPVAEIVLQHHERMNGSGYPAGLKGDDILLEARILSVSDVVEAMASHRPYRPALGIAAATEEIERNKGVLYDPDVVAACLKLFREKDFKFKF